MVRGIVAAVLAAIAVVIALEPWAPYRRTGGNAPLPPVAAPAQPVKPLVGGDASSGRVIARPWVAEPTSPRSERRQAKQARDVEGAPAAGQRSAGRKPVADRAPTRPAHEQPSAAKAIAVPALPPVRVVEPAGQAMADARLLPPPVPAPSVQPPPAISGLPVPSEQPLPVASPAPALSVPPPVTPLPPEAEEMAAAAEPATGPGATAAALPETGQGTAAEAKVATAPVVPNGAAAAPTALPASQPWLRPWTYTPPQAPTWAPTAPRGYAAAYAFRPPAAAYAPVAPLPPYFPVPWQVPAWVPVAPRPAGVVPAWPLSPASAAGLAAMGIAQPLSPFAPPTRPQAPLPSAPAQEVLVARPVGYAGLTVTVPGPSGQPQTLVFPPFAVMMALCSVPGELVKAVQRLPLQ